MECTVWAGPLAVFTTHTAFGINLHYALLIFEDGLVGAFGHTYWLLAMVTSHGYVVGVNVRHPIVAAHALPISSCHLVNITPLKSNGVVMFILTGYLAGFAT